MSRASSTSSVNDSTIGVGGMSLQDDMQATPIPKSQKIPSESSLSTMTPPNSSHGAALTSNGVDKQLTRDTQQLFVKSQDGDDVFGQHSTAGTSQAAEKQPNSAASIIKAEAVVAGTGARKFNIRADRLKSPVTSANAQGSCLPEACLFVANLATARSDDALEESCQEYFKSFGPCFTKVRRDKNRHPFAIVQYVNCDDADNAIRSSQNVLIEGRNIRVEHVKAPRTIVLTRIGGGAITTEEAHEVLAEYGTIAKMHPTTNSDARELGLPEGMWVQFAYYLDGKDVMKSFNSTSTQYRVHIPPEVEARTYTGPGGSPVVRGFRTPRSTTDQKSVFVGNLPPETTEDDLRQRFGSYGSIRSVNIIHKPIHGGTGFNIFGFIEYSTMSEAESAASQEVELWGNKIRVEPKEYSARRHTRLQQYSPGPSPYHRGPRHTMPVAFNNAGMAMHYNNGFYAMQSPSLAASTYAQAPNAREMSPFHHQGGYSGIYATPPPSMRMGRRNDMLYTGSPHHMAQWSPFMAAPNYTNSMMQIPEELEGHRY